MKFQTKLVAVAAAALLVACGGGVETAAVRVAGDSLTDQGVFGFKFTVQGTASDPQYIWTDRVTSALGVSALCSRYVATGASTVALNPQAASCSSYGVAGARVNPAGVPGDSTGFSVVQQLKEMSSAKAFGATELLLVDGGGNDAADLIGAYLGAGADGGAAYVALLSELLTPAQVGAAVAGGSTGLAVAGGQYMVALGNALANAIDTHALGNGAQRVVLVNAPNVVKTPRFQSVLAGVAAASGGGATGAAAAAQVAALAESWVTAYNGQLQARYASQAKVAMVDFYGEFNKWLTTPSAYGLTNVTTPACPVVGVESSGLPAYSIGTCTVASLSAAPQPGTSGPDWWKTYVFADNFHGSPRTNQLMADMVLTTLATKGWK